MCYSYWQSIEINLFTISCRVICMLVCVHKTITSRKCPHTTHASENFPLIFQNNDAHFEKTSRKGTKRWLKCQGMHQILKKLSQLKTKDTIINNLPVTTLLSTTFCAPTISSSIYYPFIFDIKKSLCRRYSSTSILQS